MKISNYSQSSSTKYQLPKSLNLSKPTISSPITSNPLDTKKTNLLTVPNPRQIRRSSSLARKNKVSFK